MKRARREEKRGETDKARRQNKPSSYLFHDRTSIYPKTLDTRVERKDDHRSQQRQDHSTRNTHTAQEKQESAWKKRKEHECGRETQELSNSRHIFKRAYQVSDYRNLKVRILAKLLVTLFSSPFSLGSLSLSSSLLLSVLVSFFLPSLAASILLSFSVSLSVLLLSPLHCETACRFLLFCPFALCSLVFFLSSVFRPSFHSSFFLFRYLLSSLSFCSFVVSLSSALFLPFTFQPHPFSHSFPLLRLLSDLPWALRKSLIEQCPHNKDQAGKIQATAEERTQDERKSNK